MLVLAIDPGPRKSGWVEIDYDDLSIFAMGHDKNDVILDRFVDANRYGYLPVFEMVQSQGMPVGQEVFYTCVWIGRFQQHFGGDASHVYRNRVKAHMCHNVCAKDSNVRRAVMDRYDKSGGGKDPEIGTKREPGPLYAIRELPKSESGKPTPNHVWQALATGLTFIEMDKERKLLFERPLDKFTPGQIARMKDIYKIIGPVIYESFEKRQEQRFLKNFGRS